MANQVKVLVIDDDVTFAKTTVDILLESGINSSYVENGQLGIETLKKQFHDVVLLDMKMPVMNGLETYRVIKKVSPKTMVVMITAYRMEEMIRASLKEGAYAVLNKPLDMHHIFSMIERSQKGGAYIAVVDDDPNTCKTFKDNLEEKGFSVVTATDGDEAIRLAKERPQDVIFIDVKLPPINGVETFLEIKKINPNSKVVIMTAYGKEMDDLLEQAKQKGSYACLHKPIDMEKLLSMIDEIVSHKETPVLPTATTKGNKILVVDDDDNARKALSDLLKECGYNVVSASTGEEAVELANKENPLVVLLDTRLPGIDGYAVCRQLKAIKDFKGRIVVYTGYVDVVDDEKAREAGADDYVVKTDDFEDLLKVLAANAAPA
jgi:CheY-like chemotaxis protein